MTGLKTIFSSQNKTKQKTSGRLWLAEFSHGRQNSRPWHLHPYNPQVWAGSMNNIMRYHFPDYVSLTWQKGLYRCNYGPSAVNLEFITREIILCVPDPVTWVLRRDQQQYRLSLWSLRNRSPWVLQLLGNELCQQQPEWAWKKVQSSRSELCPAISLTKALWDPEERSSYALPGFLTYRTVG